MVVRRTFDRKFRISSGPLRFVPVGGQNFERIAHYLEFKIATKLERIKTLETVPHG